MSFLAVEHRPYAPPARPENRPHPALQNKLRWIILLKVVGSTKYSNPTTSRYEDKATIGLFHAHLLGIPSPKWVCLTTPHPTGSTAPAEEIICFCERWAAEALFALTTMTACSQRVELRAA